jgi:hypothetical protein
MSSILDSLDYVGRQQGQTQDTAYVPAVDFLGDRDVAD